MMLMKRRATFFGHGLHIVERVTNNKYYLSQLPRSYVVHTQTVNC